MKKCTVCLEDKEDKAYDKYRSICRKCRNHKYTKSYLLKEGNVEKMREYQKNYQKKHREDNHYYDVYCKALWQLSSRLRSKKNNVVKIHLESLFTTDMNWDNYGSYWEIDHIISGIKMAKLGYDVDSINKLENLRPMIVKENRSRYKEE